MQISMDNGTPCYQYRICSFEGTSNNSEEKGSSKEESLSDHCVHQPSLALVLAERIGFSKKKLEKASAYFKLLRSNHQKGSTSNIADDRQTDGTEPCFLVPTTPVSLILQRPDWDPSAPP